MATTKRATVYFDEQLHRALRRKAAATEQSVSELVNAAVRNTLAEGADDLAAFRSRAKEPTLVFEDLARDMKRRGKVSRSRHAICRLRSAERRREVPAALERLSESLMDDANSAG